MTSSGCFGDMRYFRRCCVGIFALYLIRAVNADGAEYQVIEIGDRAVGETRAYDLNNCGQVVGDARFHSATDASFLFSRRVFRRLDAAPSEAYGINRHGVVCGATTGTSGGARACYWNSRGVTLLPDRCVAARDINSAGSIVGDCNDSAGIRCFLYMNGALTILPTLGGVVNYPTAINDRNEVVGYVFDAASRKGLPFIYSNGALSTFSTPDGKDGVANDINDLGTVVGHTIVVLGTRSSFIYKNGVATTIPAPHRTSLFAAAVNNRDQVVGTSISQAHGTRAFLYREESLYDLNSLIPASSGWILQAARAINDRGEIAGWGLNPDGQVRGFLLTPTTGQQGCSLLGRIRRIVQAFRLPHVPCGG